MKKFISNFTCTERNVNVCLLYKPCMVELEYYKEGSCEPGQECHVDSCNVPYFNSQDLK